MYASLALRGSRVGRAAGRDLPHHAAARTPRSGCRCSYYRPFFWAPTARCSSASAQRRYWQRARLFGRAQRGDLQRRRHRALAAALGGGGARRCARALGFADGDFVIGLSAVLRPEKNPLQLVEAIARAAPPRHAGARADDRRRPDAPGDRGARRARWASPSDVLDYRPPAGRAALRRRVRRDGAVQPHGRDLLARRARGDGAGPAGGALRRRRRGRDDPPRPERLPVPAGRHRRAGRAPRGARRPGAAARMGARARATRRVALLRARDGRPLRADAAANWSSTRSKRENLRKRAAGAIKGRRAHLARHRRRRLHRLATCSRRCSRSTSGGRPGQLRHRLPRTTSTRCAPRWREAPGAASASSRATSARSTTCREACRGVDVRAAPGRARQRAALDRRPDRQPRQQRDGLPQHAGRRARRRGRSASSTPARAPPTATIPALPKVEDRDRPAAVALRR